MAISIEVAEPYNEKSALEMTSHVESAGAMSPEITEDFGEGFMLLASSFAGVLLPEDMPT